MGQVIRAGLRHIESPHCHWNTCSSVAGAANFSSLEDFGISPVRFWFQASRRLFPGRRSFLTCSSLDICRHRPDRARRRGDRYRPRPLSGVSRRISDAYFFCNLDRIVYLHFAGIGWLLPRPVSANICRRKAVERREWPSSTFRCTAGQRSVSGLSRRPCCFVGRTVGIRAGRESPERC